MPFTLNPLMEYISFLKSVFCYIGYMDSVVSSIFFRKQLFDKFSQFLAKEMGFASNTLMKNNFFLKSVFFQFWIENSVLQSFAKKCVLRQIY